MLTAPVLAGTRALATPDESHVIRGHYIVVLKQDAEAAEVAHTHGLKSHRGYKHALNGFAAEVPEGRLHALKNDPRVDFVEPDVEVFAMAQTIPTGVQRIGATRSAAAKIDGLDTRVNADIAILDTGIDLTHPDLNVYRAVSFCTNNTTGNDGDGHGTHVAGIAAALDNGIGVVGVAPGARLWAVKVLDDSGGGTLSSMIAGVDYVTQNADQIEVANLSLSGMGSADSLRLAIQNSVAKGVVYVVAAGNANNDVFGSDRTFGTADDYFPASFPEVMAVSAMADSDGKAGGVGLSTTYGLDDTIATFSDYSLAVVQGNPVISPGRAIDLAAPGVNIYSTYKGGAYATMSGTSMAAPHVAGAVALYISQYGRAYNASGVALIRQALINSAEPQTHWGPANTNPGRELFDVYPEGLVNVAAIGGSTPSTTPVPNDPPTVAISSPVTGASFPYATAITFSGSASDLQDGNLTSKLTWTSSIDGQIGAGGSFFRTLSVGTHTITARVTDSAGNVASTSTTITIQNNNPPTVTISSPATGTSFAYGATITFSGSASDLQDGSLTSSMSWTSSINGLIGSGGSFWRTLSSGTHLITARVTDSAGNTTATSVTLVVNTPSLPPSVTATVSPWSSSFVYGTLIAFSGTALDSKDGDITAKLIWTSSIDGQIGTGGTASRTLSVGTHTITARATDSAGLTGTASMAIVVAPAPTPTLRATVSSDRASYFSRNVAYIRLVITDGTNPVLGATVNAVLTTANGKKILMNGTTSSTGDVTFQYTVNRTYGGMGVYSVSAVASKSGYNSASASTTFTVLK